MSANISIRLRFLVWLLVLFMGLFWQKVIPEINVVVHHYAIPDVPNPRKTIDLILTTDISMALPSAARQTIFLFSIQPQEPLSTAVRPLPFSASSAIYTMNSLTLSSLQGILCLQKNRRRDASGVGGRGLPESGGHRVRASFGYGP
jgi:hypothetical protein